MSPQARTFVHAYVTATRQLMRTARLAAGAAAAALLLTPGAARAQRRPAPAPLAERAAWRALFDSAGVRGTFVVRRLGRRGGGANGVVSYDVYDRDAYEYLASDTARARRPYLPASTFKIPNTLIALELGVARDERQLFPFTWPRSDVSELWNRDQTLYTALKYSAVPVYQQIARRVGEPRYRTWLARLDYGNRDPGGGVDHFWLDGALRTSAVEQVEFLGRLAERRLPMSERSQRIVSEMLVREANDCYTLRAKTGLVGIAATRQLGAGERVGWYVGWVQSDTAAWAFAMNLDATAPGAAAARIPLTRALLARAGAIPARGCGQ